MSVSSSPLLAAISATRHLVLDFAFLVLESEDPQVTYTDPGGKDVGSGRSLALLLLICITSVSLFNLTLLNVILSSVKLYNSQTS